jgi:hypothetical protein
MRFERRLQRGNRLVAFAVIGVELAQRQCGGDVLGLTCCGEGFKSSPRNHPNLLSIPFRAALIESVA